MTRTPSVSVVCLLALAVLAGCLPKKKQATRAEFAAGTKTFTTAVKTWLDAPTSEHLDAAIAAGDALIEPLDNAWMKAHEPGWDSVHLLRGTLRIASLSKDPKAVPDTANESPWDSVFSAYSLVQMDMKP